MPENNSRQVPVNKEQRAYHNYWVWAVLLAVILFTTAIRMRLLAAPLERDEGEYAYAGQLILQGVPPYAQVYNMKLPGIYAAYALIMAIFGQTHVGIHLGLLVINAATMLVLFLLAKRLFGPVAGLISATTFGLLSLGWQVQGIFANAEHFVLLPALAGILLLQNAVDSQKWSALIGGALLCGLAFVIKQHGAAFIAFGGLYLFFCELRRRPFKLKPLTLKITLYFIGAALPFVATCLILWGAGVFDKFWFWTFTYAREYAAGLPLSIGWLNLKAHISRCADSAILFWIMAGIGVTALLWHRQSRRHWFFVLGFLVLSFISICPGFYFRPHYFMLILPAVALLAGVGAAGIQDIFARSRSVLIKRIIPIFLVLIVLFYACYQQRHFFFILSPVTTSRTIYGGNPFPESLEIAKYIKSHSSESDHIVVLGSEPQIFFYANRRSATGYIYAYPLMELHPYALQMQQEMIREVEQTTPKFLVLVNVSASWSRRGSSEKLIFEWFQQYIKKHYRTVGVVDISQNRTIYRWDREARIYQPQSQLWVKVFHRKSASD